MNENCELTNSLKNINKNLTFMLNELNSYDISDLDEIKVLFKLEYDHEYILKYEKDHIDE